MATETKRTGGRRTAARGAKRKGDEYASSRSTTEGRVYTVTGGDWDSLFGGDPIAEERLVLNMGPQHPSTHGVLRLVLELEGETVTDARVVVGYLHTGIEKNDRVPQLDPGRHLRHAHGLPLADVQRDGLLPRRGAAARASRRPNAPGSSG